MGSILRNLVSGLVFIGLITSSVFAADGLSPEIKSKVSAKIKEIEKWSSDPAIVKAVEAYNASKPAEYAAITNDSWKTLTVLSPEVKALTKNETAVFLKSKKDAAISEAFISGSDGTKVAFLAKTSSWSHKGKPKHDVPMTGKTWTGEVEVDESTGLQQIQISLPVMSGGKAIGSLVVGLSVAKL